MIAQLPLPFAGPALAAPPSGAGQTEGKDDDSDFNGWMDSADRPAEASGGDPLSMLPQISALVFQPLTQPSPDAPNLGDDAVLVSSDTDAPLQDPKLTALSEILAAPPPDAGTNVADLSAEMASILATPALTTEQISRRQPAASVASATQRNMLQKIEKSLLDAASGPQAIDPVARADMAAESEAKVKTAPGNQAANAAAAAGGASVNDGLALAAAAVVSGQNPQPASARASATTPHWSRLDAKLAVAPPGADVAVPQLITTEPQTATLGAQAFDIGQMSQSQPSPQPAETSIGRMLATPTSANLHSQLLIHAPTALQKQVEVLLSPQELGHVKFQIRHSGDSVSIFLSAERPETMDMLRRNGEDLLREFRQAGFAGASLDFGQWGQQQQPQQQQPPPTFSLPEDFSLTPQIARPAPSAPSLGDAPGLNLRL